MHGAEHGVTVEKVRREKSLEIRRLLKVFPALGCVCKHTDQSPSGCCGRETPRKRFVGGREEARGAVCYSSQLRIGAWNCDGLSNVTMKMCKNLGYDILALSDTPWSVVSC